MFFWSRAPFQVPLGSLGNTSTVPIYTDISTHPPFVLSFIKKFYLFRSWPRQATRTRSETKYLIWFTFKNKTKNTKYRSCCLPQHRIHDAMEVKSLFVENGPKMFCRTGKINVIYCITFYSIENTRAFFICHKFVSRFKHCLVYDIGETDEY